MCLGPPSCARGGAANLGAWGVATEFLLICNPDSVSEGGSVDSLIEAARAHPEAGAFGPAILEADGALYPSARAQPTLAAGIGHGVLGPIWPGNPWTRAYLAEREPTERIPVWLSGACLLVRTTAWREVGDFDPRYFMYFEDVDLGDGRPRPAGRAGKCPRPGSPTWGAPRPPGADRDAARAPRERGARVAYCVPISWRRQEAQSR